MMMNRYFMYKGYLNGIRIPGIQSRIRIQYFSFEQQTINDEKTKESNETKVEQRMNEKVKQRTK
jgi:hypothetical protein